MSVIFTNASYLIYHSPQISSPKRVIRIMLDCKTYLHLILWVLTLNDSNSSSNSSDLRKKYNKSNPTKYSKLSNTKSKPQNKNKSQEFHKSWTKHPSTPITPTPFASTNTLVTDHQKGIALARLKISLSIGTTKLPRLIYLSWTLKYKAIYRHNNKTIK